MLAAFLWTVEKFFISTKETFWISIFAHSLDMDDHAHVSKVLWLWKRKSDGQLCIVWNGLYLYRVCTKNVLLLHTETYKSSNISWIHFTCTLKANLKIIPEMQCLTQQYNYSPVRKCTYTWELVHRKHWFWNKYNVLYIIPRGIHAL